MEIVISDECIGCGKCVKRCSHHVLKLENRKIIVNDLSLCKGCRKCEGVCPKQAINIKLTPKEARLRSRKQKIKKGIAGGVFILIILIILYLSYWN